MIYSNEARQSYHYVALLVMSIVHPVGYLHEWR